MTRNQGTREPHPQLGEFLRGLVDTGASVITLEKDVPVATNDPGLVFRVTPRKITGTYPGLTKVQFDGQTIIVECTLDNYGPLVNDEGSPLNLLPIYVSDDFADPMSLDEGVKNLSSYLGGNTS